MPKYNTINHIDSIQHVKHLFIYRHADTTPASRDQKDYDRTLSVKGEDECQRMGKALKNNAIHPDYALCSPAHRTRQTWDLTTKAAGIQNTADFLEPLYLATPEDIAETLAILPGQIKAPIVIAHNPGLHQLCQHLARASESADLNRLAMRFPPATLALFEINIAAWHEFSLNSDARLILLTYSEETVK